MSTLTVSQKTTTVNREINLFRLLFSLVVLMVHTHGLSPDNPADYPFMGGYLAVEFFFILSGYFVVESILKRAPDSSKKIAQMVWRKYLRIIPYVLIN